MKLLWFIAIVGLGLSLGITDDEAYYWVLGQRPALGYAFHPPAIGWSIWLSDVIFGPVLRALFGDTYWTRVWITRAPALALMGLSLRLVREFLRSILPGKKDFSFLLAFPGVFATCWMMVPDLPLILGWCLLFVGTFKALNRNESSLRTESLIVLGSALLLWSKFSGVLAIGSAVFAMFFFVAPLNRIGRMRGSIAILVGMVLGLVPILIWNAQHDWMSLRFQFLERHQGGGGFNGLRGARFILIQLAAVGPLLFTMPALLFRTKFSANLRRYFFIWFLPAGAVFFVQPFYSDFKPHWALIAWWPLAIALTAVFHGVAPLSSRFRSWARVQMGWATLLTVILWSSLLIPWVSYLGVRMKGPEFNPTIDIGNDVKAWSTLSEKWKTELTEEERALPIAGSRYQTASQAAFALDGIAVPKNRVLLFPKGINAKDEWPDIDISEVGAPEFSDWGRLKTSVLFIADNRYSAPPSFGKANCTIRFKHDYTVLGWVGKQITVYRCDPLP